MSSACHGTGQENQTTSTRTRDYSRWTQILEGEVRYLWCHAETKARRGMGNTPSPSWTRRKLTGRATIEIKTSNKQWPAKWNLKTVSKYYRNCLRQCKELFYRKHERTCFGWQGGTVTVWKWPTLSESDFFTCWLLNKQPFEDITVSPLTLS